VTRANFRADIAAAASTVDGVEVQAYYRATDKVGMGYVERLRTDYPNRLGGEDYWGVVIALPNDQSAAQQWMDEHQTALVTALKAELVVTQCRGEIHPRTDNPSVKVLVVEGHRAGEE
jgi:hypothetical protein